MTEHNVLNLIESGKYHSCVILGYSFDPIFFDEIVYPTLKRAGVVNILVFVDYQMLEQSLDKMILHNFRISDGYSVSSIKTTSAFHPKVLQLLGEKESLSLIGSGNPTFGGYSRNQEIWFGFKTVIEDVKKSHVVRDIWDYILTVVNKGGGIVQKKLSMAADHASWIKDAKAQGINYEGIGGKHDLRIIKNDGSSIYSELLSALSEDTIQHVSIHSPFYDEKLTLLKAFNDDLSPKKIDVFVQPEYIVLPLQNVKSLPGTIQFYNVDNLLKRQGKSSHRYVHAKLYEFVGKKNSYLLFGSPNLSFAAMGNAKANGRNEELAILIKSPKEHSYFELMGFEAKKATLIDRSELPNIITTPKANENVTDTITGKIHVSSIDGVRGAYEVHISEKLDETFARLVIQNTKGEEVQNIEKFEVKNAGNFIRLIYKYESKGTEEGTIGFLADKSSRRISNKSVVNTRNLLAKSYPSQRYKDIQIALSAIEQESDELWRLFSLFDPTDFAVSTKKKTIIKSSDGGKAKKGEEPETETGAVMPYDEFVQVEEGLEGEQGFDYLAGRTSLTEILDVMSRLVRNVGIRTEDKIAEFEETEDIEQSGGDIEEDAEEDSKDVIRNDDWLLGQRKKASKYFNKWGDVLEQRYESSDMLPHHLYAIHAISTYLLIYSALKQYKIMGAETGRAIIPLIDTDDVDDLLNFTIDLNGLMYSKLLRVKYYDETVMKYEKNLHNEIMHSALNGITLISMVLSIKLPSEPFYDFVKDSCVLCMLNIMDITTANSVKLKKEDVIEHLSSFANLANGVLDMKKVKTNFEKYWDMYKSAKVGKVPVSYSDIESKKIYYTPKLGYVKIARLIPLQGKNAVKVTFGMPGKDWDEEINDFAYCKDYHCPPAKLFAVTGIQ